MVPTPTRSVLHSEPLAVRRQFLVALLGGLMPAAGSAQDGSEPALRAAFAAYLQAWNARDAGAIAAVMTEDVEWVSLYSQGRAGRGSVVDYIKTAMPLYALDVAITRVRLEGGAATVLFSGRFLEFPYANGKYTRVWNRDVLLSRWRFSDGHWRITYLNENAGQSAELAKKAGL